MKHAPSRLNILYHEAPPYNARGIPNKIAYKPREENMAMEEERGLSKEREKTGRWS